MDILHHCEKPFMTSPSLGKAHRTTGSAHSFLLHVDARCQQPRSQRTGPRVTPAPCRHRHRRYGQHPSRLQGLTRTLDTSLAVADGLIRAIRAATPEAAAPLVDLKDQGEYAL